MVFKNRIFFREGGVGGGSNFVCSTKSAGIRLKQPTRKRKLVFSIKKSDVGVLKPGTILWKQSRAIKYPDRSYTTKTALYNHEIKKPNVKTAKTNNPSGLKNGKTIKILRRSIKHRLQNWCRRVYISNLLIPRFVFLTFCCGTISYLSIIIFILIFL